MHPSDAQTGPLPPAAATALDAAGIDATDSAFTPLKSGTDSVPFAVTTNDGRELVVKVRRPGSRSRYPVAAWASARMRAAGVPAARILWHSADACVEVRCSGRPVATQPPTRSDLDAAILAGQMARRRLHTIEVNGFGQLDSRGHGQCATVQEWLLRDVGRRDVLVEGHDLPGLLAEVHRTLAGHASHLAWDGPQLLHGDFVGRHLFTDGRHITGVVDLESVRGGDPLTELAGWSLREPASVTEALFAGYFDGPVPEEHLLRLLLLRLRIASSLLHFHVAQGDGDMVRFRASQLHADLADLDHGLVPAIPRITPDAATDEQRRP